MFVRHPSCTDFHSARARNLGEGGACLVADTPLPEGAEVYVGFFLPDDPNPLVAMARVVWTRPGAERCVLGLAFVPGSAGQRHAMARLADYVKGRRVAVAAAVGRS